MIGAATALVLASVLVDFEQGLGGSWDAQGPLRASRDPAPEGGPGGQGLWLATEGRSALKTTPGFPEVDWTECSEVRFWVYRSADEAALRERSTLEFMLVEADNRTKFWRKIELDHVGWRQVVVPIKWCRWSSGRVPELSEVVRLAFWFRDAAELWIDEISAEFGGPQWATLDDLRAQFPDPAEVRAVTDDRLWILTDAPDLDLDALRERLNAAADLLDQELGLAPTARPAALLVFADEDAYRDFPEAYMRAFASLGARPESDGYTLMGVATSYWDPEQGTDRPVYTHEFVHAYLHDALGFSNRSEWLHEGLATRVQLQLHPQAGLARDLRRWLRRPPALGEVCSGEPIGTRAYWVAMTVVGALLEREDAQTLIRDLAESETTDLGPHLEARGLDWDTWTEQWRGYCETRYAE